MDIKCPNCGAENPPEDFFCGACGNSLLPQEDGESWSKTHGIPGFWDATTSDGPDGAKIETRFSLFGFKETTVYPRWMITISLGIFVGLLFILGLLMIPRAFESNQLEYAAVGFGAIGIALLVAYIAYRLYYAPPQD